MAGLDIKNFPSDGIEITGGDTQVTGCFIGTAQSGEVAAPNASGILIQSSFNTIGGLNVSDRNVISGNIAAGQGDGIEIGASGRPLYANNVIETNFIGIDAAGMKALANGQAGVADFGSNNTYGGTTAGLGNVISGNAADGIKSDSSITIEGNFIGTDATGNIALGNGPAGAGIAAGVFPSTQVITTTITNNLVSGNKQGGIEVSVGVKATSVYTISNNKIGTNAAGTAALGNVGTGLALESVENTTVDNNLISANTMGISLSGFGPDVEHNVFQGNRIGTDITGTLNLGNAFDGINFSNAVGNQIGGTSLGQANIIAFNGGYGIDLTSSGSGTATKQVQITENSIFGNTNRGIYVSPGGTNNFVTPPTLTFTPGSGGFGTLSGALVGLTSGDIYLVEIFSNPTVPVVGLEQGKTFITPVTVIASGTTASFSMSEPNGVYTATTTDPIGDTSAFSHSVGAPALPSTTTTLESSLNPSTFGQAVTFTAEVGSSSPGTPTGTVTFTIDGVAETPVSLVVGGGMNQAQFTTSSLGVGQYSVAATYSGDATFVTSTGNTLTQTITAAPLVATTTRSTTSPNPSVSGQPVVLTATITSVDGSAVGGTVAFVEGSTILGFAVVGAGGLAIEMDTLLPVGSNPIVAVYNGDALHTGSVSNAVAPLVEPLSTIAPTVVSLQRYGFHAQPTSLVLGFSGALDATSAQNVSNYQIVLLNKHGHPEKGHSIAVLEAIYNPSTFSITLIPAQRLDIHYRYRLTVNGTTQTGVRGDSELLLDGKSNGKSGSNYVAEIVRKTLVGPAPGYIEPIKPAAVVRAKSVELPSTTAVNLPTAVDTLTAVDMLADSGELAALASQKHRLHPQA